MVRLTVNGEPREVDAPDDMPLLWVLRDLLGLTGTRYGCGVGLCGTCTVHVDGEPARACTVRMSSLEGSDVRTVEGLDPEGRHPLQRAWMELNVPQCGYCQAGQLMSAAALLASTSRPTEAQVDQALAGNLCRCGTYQRIRNAVLRAAELQGGEA